MAQSLNTKVELTIKATSFMGLATYGDMMVGDRALEFYNERNREDYIQIPWECIDHIAASVMNHDKTIARFAVFTTLNTNAFSFSTRDNKKTLRAIREHIGDDKLVRSPTFFGVLKRGVASIPGNVKSLVNRKK
ncbi:DUF956 family protein [uncultured Parolsenella sp.]|uniref:DUF956 family protein n=1 Tax=uncultured Parolsenella sp. TaxID=2083008 RepID=UPI0025CD1984|nr:DUF956 family protein [uncultured Parolsenella sp.]